MNRITADRKMSALPRSGVLPLATDTWLIPHVAPVLGNDLYLPVNSMVIRGSEPVIVDTGAPIHRASWMEKVFALVEPRDVRWIWLSHEDGDHTGSLEQVLRMCPKATVLTTGFAAERVSLEDPDLMPLARQRWVEPGETVNIGDRELRAVRPPIWDGPTTRGVLDERTGVLWAVDSFAALTPGPAHLREEIPDDLYDTSFPQLNSSIAPWHQYLDPERYQVLLDSVAALQPLVVASAHGPVLTDAAITDALVRVQRLAGAAPAAADGQAVLDKLLRATQTDDHSPQPAGLRHPLRALLGWLLPSI